MQRRLATEYGEPRIISQQREDQRALLPVEKVVEQVAWIDREIDVVDAIAITAGPEGNLWVTDESQNKIWKLTTGGGFTGFALPPTPNRGANSITVGADSNLWIGEPGNNSIGRMTTGAPLLGEFPIPTANSNPRRPTAGSSSLPPPAPAE